jgi:CheY-like chemotaxis protein
MRGLKGKTVLVASHDPELADVRKHLLEGAGYRVISASSLPEITAACKNNKLHLVLIGHSLPPSEKRRVCAEAREHCKVPILELYNGKPPALVPASYIHQHDSLVAEDFIEAVNALLR